MKDLWVSHALGLPTLQSHKPVLTPLRTKRKITYGTPIFHGTEESAQKLKHSWFYWKWWLDPQEGEGLGNSFQFCHSHQKSYMHPSLGASIASKARSIIILCISTTLGFFETAICLPYLGNCASYWCLINNTKYSQGKLQKEACDQIFKFIVQAAEWGRVGFIQMEVRWAESTFPDLGFHQRGSQSPRIQGV